MTKENPSVRDLPAQSGPDPNLAERLRGLSTEPTPLAPATAERIYDDVRAECDAEDAKWTGFVRSRSTTVRRGILGSVFLLLTVIAVGLFPMVDPAQRTAAWWITLALYSGLIVTCVWAATRPLHVPPLSPSWVGTIVFLVLGACIGTAFVPFNPSAIAMGSMFGGCMGTGLLLGVPVFGLVRLFDRGNTFGALMAAAAAGLAGNLWLKANCPVDATAHVLLEHASVALIFVLGLLAIHRLIPAK